MTFLAKLGSYLAKGIALLAGLGPLITPWLGSSQAKTAQTVVSDLTLVGQQVLAVESVIQTPGSGVAKLTAATPLVAQIVKTSELVSGHNIANESLFIQGCQKITDGTADVLNSLSPNNVKSGGTPVPPVTPVATNPA